jgi:protein-tyrosine-phosphatase
MAELGIDISDQSPKILTYDTVESTDVVITMGCGDTCPVFPGVSYRDWSSRIPRAKASNPCALSAPKSRPEYKTSSPSCYQPVPRQPRKRRVPITNIIVSPRPTT